MESFVTAHALTHVGGNPRKENQDTFFTAVRGDEGALLGVFDGHGIYGMPVATAVRDVFAAADSGALADLPALYKAGDDAAREAILGAARARDVGRVEMEPDGTLVCRMWSGARQVLLGGTTASLARIRGLDLEVSHVGDSEVMVIHETSREFTVLTKDHGATSVGEWERVLAETPNPPRVEFDTAGGAYGGGQPARSVFTVGEGGKWALNPAGGFYVSDVRRTWAAYVIGRDTTINMFRAIGDFGLRKNGVNFLPDVIQHRLKSVGRSFVVAASDGLFDVMQYEKIRDVVLEAAALAGATTESITAALLAAGLGEGKRLFGSGQDNTTVALAIVEPRCPVDVCIGEPEGHESL